MDKSSSRMYRFTRRLGKRFRAWDALKFLLGCHGGVESVLTARKISPCRMTIHARRHEQGIHRQLTACSDVLPLSQTASVPYLGVRIHTILVALLSKNTPYEASLLLFAAPCHAGVSGHGHCGGNLCGDLCSLRQLRKPMYPTLSGG